MKKYLLLLICSFSLLACNIDEEDSFYQEPMPIQSVDMPSEFTLGETYEISVSYTRPNGCYRFNNFYIQPNGNTRTVFVIDNIYTNINCTDAIENATVSFNFEVIYSETYVFQFYQGNVGGEDQYLIIEVPVIE